MEPKQKQVTPQVEWIATNLAVCEWFLTKTKYMKQKLSQFFDNGMDLGIATLNQRNPLGRLPAWARKDVRMYKNTVKINRFLTFQEKRILKAIELRQYNKATLLWLILLKNSKAYQMVLFHRCKPDWYWTFPVIQVREELRKLMNKIRIQDLRLELTRFYIPKANGKLRPIGSPNLASKAIAKSLNDLIYLLHSDLGNYQHGFRHNRGVFTALWDLVQKLKNHKGIIYEFDLESFFNKVRPSWVYRGLLRKSSLLAEVMARILVFIDYKFKELKPEKELIYKGRVEQWGKLIPKIERSGMPQGLPFSPILSTIAMENFKTNEQFVMYADDGIYLGKDMKAFKEWMDDMYLIGLKIAEKKSGLVKDKLQFLGFSIDIERQTIEYDGHKKSWYDPDLGEWLKKATAWYGKKPKKWTWEVNKGSYLALYASCNASIWQKTICVLFWPFGKSYKGYRYFWGIGVVDILQSSSECLNLLAGRLYELNLRPAKALRTILKNKFGNYGMLKGKGAYYEEIWENALVAYYKTELPEWKNLGTQNPRLFK